jgi:peroxiredoxin
VVTSFCLLTCGLALGQPLERPEWQLAPHLFPGLELVYSGSFSEEALIPGVKFERTYRLDSTLFVLESKQDGWQTAFLTAMSLRGPKDGPTPPTSVRLEIGNVNKKGRIKGKVNLGIPLAGPPTIESGAIVELPAIPVRSNNPWFTTEEGRPPWRWEILGTAMCNGTSCLKLSGEQLSEDWDRPRADQTAWRRRDTIWLAPQLGIAYRVERVIERRDPARRDPTHRLTVRYDLESRIKYPGKFFEDRQNEIEKALKFREEAETLLSQPGPNPLQIEALQNRIARHLETGPTPYRLAITHLQTRLESARRGELNPTQVHEEEPLTMPATKVGDRVPDFLCTDLTTKESVRLYRKLGKPILIAFYNPATETGKQVLDFCQGMSNRYPKNLTILPMAVTDDPALACRQHAERKLPFPILDGRGLHRTFGVDATPRFVVLDKDGILRTACTGWSPENTREIGNEIRGCFEK